MKKVFELSKDVLFTFGILILIFTVLALAVGNKAADISTLFMYGDKAISLGIIFQLFGLSLCVNLLKSFFNSNFMIKRISRTIRHIILFILVFILLVGMILFFNWFISDDKLPWILTSVAFIISFTVSTVITELKQKSETNELQDALIMHLKHQEDIK